MEFLWMILIGAIVGAIAKLIMPGRDPGGIIVTIIIGILGGILGGWLFRTLGIGSQEGGGLMGFVGAVVGALILLALYRAVAGRRSRLP